VGPPLPYPTLREAASALARGHISASELTEVVLSRIEALNPTLHAFTDVLTAQARNEAARIDRQRATRKSLGPLAGIPIAVKDLIDTVPAICSGGLPFRNDYRPERDAVAVRRLRRAGAVVVGVTATDPGAFGVRTAAVMHPFVPDRTVGGSSGGSGAALAAGLAYGALGTDTGGSIRIPAACCGIAGFKPTFGRVSTEGVLPLASSLDHVGPMARVASDLAVLAAALDPRYGDTARRRPRRRIVVGYDPEFSADADQYSAAALDRALVLCSKFGTQTRKISLPKPAEAIDTHLAIFCADAADFHLAAFPKSLSNYPPMPRSLLELAETLPGYRYRRALRRRAEMRTQLKAVFSEVDFVIAPTLPVPPPLRDAETVTIGGRQMDFTKGLIRYTFIFDHTQNPVVSLPVIDIPAGIGTSVQVIADMNKDADAVTFATSLEALLVEVH
jgi:Asp-tRNA(Asn)/Glu-tRNA(Gln) amidotransferase A subunit family amidase